MALAPAAAAKAYAWGESRRVGGFVLTARNPLPPDLLDEAEQLMEVRTLGFLLLAPSVGYCEATHRMGNAHPAALTPVVSWCVQHLSCGAVPLLLKAVDIALGKYRGSQKEDAAALAEGR